MAGVHSERVRTRFQGIVPAFAPRLRRKRGASAGQPGPAPAGEAGQAARSAAWITIPSVKRVLGTCLLVVVVVAGLYGYVVTRQESRYLDLIEEGDAALARDDSVAAIEAFSGAIAIKPDSMAGHLKRGEAYRRRKEFDSALRDLRRAADLDPLAPHPRRDSRRRPGRHGPLLRSGGALSRVPRARRSRSAGAVQARARAAGNGATGCSGSVSAACARRSTIASRRRITCSGSVCTSCSARAEAIAPLDRALSLNPGLLHAREELAAVYGRLNRRDQQNRQLELARRARSTRVARSGARARLRARRPGRSRLLRLRTVGRNFPDDKQAQATIGRLWLERLETGGDAELEERAAGARSRRRRRSHQRGADALRPRADRSGLPGPRAGRRLRRRRTGSRSIRSPSTTWRMSPNAAASHASRNARCIDYAALEGLASPRLTAGVLARIAEAHLKAGNLAAAKQALDRALKKDPANPRARRQRRLR